MRKSARQWLQTSHAEMGGQDERPFKIGLSSDQKGQGQPHPAQPTMLTAAELRQFASEHTHIAQQMRLGCPSDQSVRV